MRADCSRSRTAALKVSLFERSAAEVHETTAAHAESSNLVGLVTFDRDFTRFPAQELELLGRR